MAWSDELRERVWSWRGHVNPAFVKEYVERSDDVAAAFKERRVKAFLAIAFATEREWSDEAAREVLAETHPSGWCKGLVTVASVELATRLAQNKEWALEEDAIAALGASGNNDERKRIAKLLARIETEEAARAFAPWISNRTVNPIATKYFKRVPEITRRALGPIAKGSGIEARGAAIVLASLDD